MAVPRLTPELDTQTGLAVRIMTGAQAWASSEVGGWIIVGVLAVSAIVATGAAVILPRLNAVDTRLTAGMTPIPAPTGTTYPEFSHFTLAPETLQDISQDAARDWNAALPFSTDPIRPSPAFFAAQTDIESYGRALDCLTTAVYYEAASEPSAGQAAVAQVVLNRVRHPAYPRTVCGVVFQGSERSTGCQFSFTCDEAMSRKPSLAGWQRARAVAATALNGHVVAAVGTATHYHTDWVAPDWASRLSKVVKIGTHIFYRWNGAWGLPSAFRSVYAGTEPIVPRMSGLSTIAFETPAEVLDLMVARMPEAEGAALPTTRLTPVLSVAVEDHGSGADALSETLEVSLLVAPTPTAPAGRPIVIQRDAPIMADPLASPAVPAARRRQRIAAPSGW